MKVKISKTEHPYCYKGHQYALDIISGKIPSSRFVHGACLRYLDDLDKGVFPFDVEYAERYLRLVQNFEHTIGHWETKNIIYEPWQCFVWMNIMGFKHPQTGKRRYRIAHVEVPRGSGKQISIYEDVPTPDGFKKWGEIEVGSRLYSRDG
ncbi:hypothetical protein EKK58_11275, partial [Candidatus Dependentiae bacterium]